MSLSLCVVMPVFNERALLPRIVSTVLSSPHVSELVIVDDGSTDGSTALIEALAKTDERIVALRHSQNRGKGAALRTGFEAVRCDVVVIQDADLEYDPADYGKLLAPIVEGRAQVVFGSRYLESAAPGGQRPCVILANRVLTAAFNLACGVRLTDMETCYKCLRRELLERLSLEQERFGIEVELASKIAALGVPIEEVPISYDSRSRAQGKKIGLRDGFEALWCILRYGRFGAALARAQRRTEQ